MYVVARPLTFKKTKNAPQASSASARAIRDQSTRSPIRRGGSRPGRSARGWRQGARRTSARTSRLEHRELEVERRTRGQEGELRRQRELDERDRDERVRFRA